MDTQTIIVIVLVILSALYLGFKVVKRKGQCGNGCGCSTKEKK